MPVLLVSYDINVAEHKTVINNDKSEVRRTDLGLCFDHFLFKGEQK